MGFGFPRVLGFTLSLGLHYISAILLGFSLTLKGVLESSLSSGLVS